MTGVAGAAMRARHTSGKSRIRAITAGETIEIGRRERRPGNYSICRRPQFRIDSRRSGQIDSPDAIDRRDLSQFFRRAMSRVVAVGLTIGVLLLVAGGLMFFVQRSVLFPRPAWFAQPRRDLGERLPLRT